MEPALFLFLSCYGISFRKAGPVVDNYPGQYAAIFLERIPYGTIDPVAVIKAPEQPD